jgi:hypothetical protein
MRTRSDTLCADLERASNDALIADWVEWSVLMRRAAAELRRPAISALSLRLRDIAADGILTDDGVEVLRSAADEIDRLAARETS